MPSPNGTSSRKPFPLWAAVAIALGACIALLGAAINGDWLIAAVAVLLAAAAIGGGLRARS
jgi:hypothetical protein